MHGSERVTSPANVFRLCKQEAEIGPQLPKALMDEQAKEAATSAGDSPMEAPTHGSDYRGEFSDLSSVRMVAEEQSPAVWESPAARGGLTGHWLLAPRGQERIGSEEIPSSTELVEGDKGGRSSRLSPSASSLEEASQHSGGPGQQRGTAEVASSPAAKDEDEAEWNGGESAPLGAEGAQLAEDLSGRLAEHSARDCSEHEEEEPAAAPVPGEQQVDENEENDEEEELNDGPAAVGQEEQDSADASAAELRLRLLREREAAAEARVSAAEARIQAAEEQARVAELQAQLDGLRRREPRRRKWGFGLFRCLRGSPAVDD